MNGHPLPPELRLAVLRAYLAYLHHKGLPLDRASATFRLLFTQ